MQLVGTYEHMSIFLEKDSQTPPLLLPSTPVEFFGFIDLSDHSEAKKKSTFFRKVLTKIFKLYEKIFPDNLIFSHIDRKSKNKEIFTPENFRKKQ